MLKRQDIKLNSSGKVSCLLLLLLTFLLINPVTTPAYAYYDGAPDDSGTGNTGNTGSNSSSSTIVSTVNIAFTPESGSASLTPISADGASAKYSIKATVGVENSGGYTVYLGSNKSELTGKNTGATINGVNSSATYEELPLNTWGYNAIEGETPGTTFSKVPTNNRGDVIASNNSTNIKTDEKTFTLSFAAHIGNDKPADTYENEITLSVISSPLEITGLTSITNMQEMTSTICSISAVGDTKQLVDLRDNKSYWVAKLPDNNCWMIQNLALDLGTEWPDASLSDYDFANTAYKPVATANAANTATIDNTTTSTRSWNFGEYVISKPANASDCGSAKTDLSACSSQFIRIGSRKPSSNSMFYSQNKATYNGSEYDAHYLVGNYYQWNTVTAGTGGTMTSGQASGSICPKNWKLPASNTSATGSFENLISSSDIGSSVTKLVENPYYFVRGGAVGQAGASLLTGVGSGGYYWSSTPTSGNNAFNFTFGGTTSVTLAYSDRRSFAFSVRCIAR